MPPAPTGGLAATSMRWVRSAGEVLALVWLIPVAIIAIGAPLALVVRLALELARKLIGH